MPISTPPIFRRLVAAIVFTVPLAFVLISWWAGSGFPYYLDNNESFLTYVQARNLQLWNPWHYSWLTAETTDPLSPTAQAIYSHNPNGPRYLSYLLLQMGASSLSVQILVLSCLATSIAVGLLWRAVGQPAQLVVPLAVALDFAGFLAWTVNIYRVWVFVLFFGMVLAVRRGRPVWVGVLTFAVLQLEFGTAAFVCSSALALALLAYGRRTGPFVVAMAVGGLLSLGLFGLQVLSFYGWDGFLAELGATYARRGTAGDAGSATRFAFQAWNGPIRLLALVARDTHNPIVFVLTLWGTISSLFALRRGGLDPEHAFLVRLTVAVLLGMMATSTVLYGYFVDAFVESVLPVSVFWIAPALGVVALDLYLMLMGSKWSRWPALYPACATLVVLPLIAASVHNFRAPLAVDLFAKLQSDYRDRTIVAPHFGPAMAVPELAFALTGGRAIRTSDVDATPDDLRRFEGLRAADGSLTYVCLDMLYLRQIEKPGAESGCDVASARMVPRGHEVVAAGSGWTIMRLIHEENRLGADPTDRLRCDASGEGCLSETFGWSSK